MDTMSREELAAKIAEMGAAGPLTATAIELSKPWAKGPDEVWFLEYFAYFVEYMRRNPPSEAIGT